MFNPPLTRSIASLLYRFDGVTPLSAAFQRSLFIIAIKSRLISFGQTARHSPIFVQPPKPSESVFVQQFKQPFFVEFRLIVNINDKWFDIIKSDRPIQRLGAFPKNPFPIFF